MKLCLLLVTLISCTFINATNNVPYQFKNVGIDNKIGSSINDQIILTDGFDSEINLSEHIGNTPTIINFVYLNCPLLCHLSLDGLVDAIKHSSYSVPNDFQIISISIDPKETNENLKNYQSKYLSQVNISNGWLFLKGNQKEIDKITKIFGYHYQYIKRTHDYAHPSVIYFYNKKITNYLEGVSYQKDLFDYSVINIKPKLNIKEKIITYCYYFDPDNQTYSLYIFNFLRLACLITVTIIAIVIVRMIINERRKNE